MALATLDFSVVVPTRNRPEMLARALASILEQRGATFELIVADDGDGRGAAAARRIGGLSVVTIDTGQRGQVAARNMAIARASARWIAFLDDDDWWADPDHLAALADALAKGGLAYASGRIMRERDGEDPQDWLGFAAHIDPIAIRHDNMLLVPGIAYDRALHERLGLFDPAFPVYWDWDWYLRLAGDGTRFTASGHDGVRVSARLDNVTSPAHAAGRAAELKRLCEKHGLTGVELKNHEVIAIEQSRARPR